MNFTGLHVGPSATSASATPYRSPPITAASFAPSHTPLSPLSPSSCRAITFGEATEHSRRDSSDNTATVLAPNLFNPAVTSPSKRQQRGAAAATKTESFALWQFQGSAGAPPVSSPASDDSDSRFSQAHAAHPPMDAATAEPPHNRQHCGAPAPSAQQSADAEDTVVVTASTGAQIHFSSGVAAMGNASSAPTLAATPPVRPSSTEMNRRDTSEETEREVDSAASGGCNEVSSTYNSGKRHSDAHALPLLLSPDELQLERLKAYDLAARRLSESYTNEAASSAGHPRGNGHDDEGEGGDKAGRDASRGGECTSFGSGDASNRSPTHHGSPCSSASARREESDITTLDFLTDTTNTILPDAFTSMFASTTHFLKSKTEAMVSAVPQPIRRVLNKAGEGIATAAGTTGSMLSNVGTYAMRSVPDRVLSPEWKYIIFVDAVNVLKCSLNVNILVAPYIFCTAGLVGGLLLILVMQVVCCYYTEVYFKAKNALKCADLVIMYGDVPRITLGHWYPTFQLWYEGIALVATVAYAALNMQALLPHMRITGSASQALSFIIPSLFSLPFVFMKRARTQPPMMTLASLLVFIAIIMMFTVFPYGSVVAATISSIDGHRSVAKLHLFPQSTPEFFVAVGICVFILTPLSRAVSVERTMKPQRYIKLLRVCVLISTVVHVTFGVCAIVSYGSHTCSVLSVSFNGHNSHVEVGVMSLLFFAFIFYIPLNMFELGELCDRRILGWRVIPRYGELGPNALRICFLAGSSLMAWCIPYYGLLIALSGCLGYSIIAIIIPATLDYVCRARQRLLQGCTPRFHDYLITFSGAMLGGTICLVGLIMTSYQTWLVVQSGHSTTC
ncbi:hypothetical protein ABL78_7461 [Leptomonas seymouri]|uniref:Amino acid transporter transmembrane domain-containing protein n=1 Tax=Leptomonas seymouri TaxID=5684 RepID=A0A0N1PBG3_LEPSE|nr:hypothetical protein ABL78_7461 [Leptomonas seymouri]|eukprot:KPI83508.1 hypothetical protein ABL78_7461 [Leptomonas seymouri]